MKNLFIYWTCFLNEEIKERQFYIRFPKFCRRVFNRHYYAVLKSFLGLFFFFLKRGNNFQLLFQEIKY